MTVSLASIGPRKGLTGHWSKWGGNRHDVFESQNEVFTEWYCQSCNRQLGAEMQPFFFEWPEGEFIRVCGICANNDCVELKSRVEYTETVVIKTSYDEFNS